MRRTAGLHDHGAARLLLEEGDQLVARQLALELDLALCIDTMEMKDGLGCIHPDHANAHPGRLPCCVFRRPHLGTSMPLGVVHPICGPGEWLMEKHGSKRRRGWRKLHLATDADTGRIAATELTDHDADD